MAYIAPVLCVACAASTERASGTPQHEATVVQSATAWEYEPHRAARPGTRYFKDLVEETQGLIVHDDGARHLPQPDRFSPADEPGRADYNNLVTVLRREYREARETQLGAHPNLHAGWSSVPRAFQTLNVRFWQVLRSALNLRIEESGPQEADAEHIYRWIVARRAAWLFQESFVKALEQFEADPEEQRRFGTWLIDDHTSPFKTQSGMSDYVERLIVDALNGAEPRTFVSPPPRALPPPLPEPSRPKALPPPSRQDANAGPLTPQKLGANLQLYLGETTRASYATISGREGNLVDQTVAEERVLEAAAAVGMTLDLSISQGAKPSPTIRA